MKKTKTKKPTRRWHGFPMVECPANSHVIIRSVDTDGGVVGDPLHCRFANAIQRTFPGATAGVFRTVTLIEVDPGTITRFNNPPNLTRAIKDFDTSGEMPSDTFILGPMPAYRTLDARSEDNRRRRASRSGRPPHRTTNSGSASGAQPVFGPRGGYRPTVGGLVPPKTP